MPLDYENETKNYYKSPSIAAEYYRSYTSMKGLDGLRFRYIAKREREIVKFFLSQVEHARILDLPAGTGKMAEVFADSDCCVLACDISEEMLEIAKQSYREAACRKVSFAVVDAEFAKDALDRCFDVAVCVRLMHRVPISVQRRILGNIMQLCRHAIVSFSVRNSYQDARVAVRRRLIGGENVGVETRGSLSDIKDMLLQGFEILDVRPVSRGLSSEWIFLLQSEMKER